VEFFNDDLKPLISKAQINTFNCTEKKYLLSADKYLTIQKLIFSAEPAFIIIQKENAPDGLRCVIDAAPADSVFSKKWTTQLDSCEKNNLVKIVFNNENQGIYISKDSLEFLSKRSPSSIRGKKSK
jgi:hypothetical protein